MTTTETPPFPWAEGAQDCFDVARWAGKQTYGPQADFENRDGELVRSGGHDPTPVGFGKYKRRAWSEVPEEYLLWLVNHADFKGAAKASKKAKAELAARRTSEIPEPQKQPTRPQASCGPMVRRKVLRTTKGTTHCACELECGHSAKKLRYSSPAPPQTVRCEACESLEPSRASLDERITFGKHKGLPWREVPASYLTWIVETFNEEKSQRTVSLARLALDVK